MSEGNKASLFTEDTDRVNSPIRHLLIKAHTLSLPVANQETQGLLVWLQWPLVTYPLNMSSRTYGSNGFRRVYKWTLSA